MTLKFNKLLKKLFKLTNRQHLYWDGANILCELKGGKVTSVNTLMWKNTNRFFVFQDSSIHYVYGDICPCVTQSACVAYSLSPAKPLWWQVSLVDQDLSEIFKRGNFLLKIA